MAGRRKKAEPVEEGGRQSQRGKEIGSASGRRKEAEENKQSHRE
jgi:hypothetical protein